MKLLQMFHIGADAILAKDCHTSGTVTKATRCWWLSIKTKPARLYASRDNTANPHIITFSYTAEGVSYEGKLYIPIRCRCPQPGETIEVYYDPERPWQYACYAFAPGISYIGW